MTQTVLILGARGRFGRHAVDAFWNAGWTVRVFDRDTDDLMAAAKGADVIVNAWNPAYPDWASTVPRLTRQVIAAAEAHGAAVIVPGNVYVFGSEAPAPWSETTPHMAANPLGRIRVAMEAAYRASSAQVIVLRAGDFLDTDASGNWFDQVIAAKARKGVLTAPGDPAAPHAWAYLPDLAEAARQLAEKRSDLAQFQDVPFAGFTLSLTEMAALAGAATGQRFAVKRMNWTPLFLMRPFWTMAKHLIEMRYLWSLPHRLDNAKLTRLLPEFRPTDPATALASALQHQIQPDQSVTAGRAHIAAE